ncbi:MAG TPA: NAD(P)-dependent alcohol dehydrogenase, partial [Thermomicrobiales bacterium]|nr:NAD(P)-dependent alcohol dehydrogenase [Thermomicrobiales bacterium]
PGHRVLINGAGGGLGTLAVQIVKAFGGVVTGVDSTDKLDMIRSLGADHVIDYTKEDFTRLGQRYDYILDIPGNHSLKECLRALEPDGTYVLIGHDGYGTTTNRWVGGVPRMLSLMARSLVTKQLPSPSFAMPSKQESLMTLSELLETGKLTPVIDRTYPLAEVPEAIRYLESGQARGKIIITMEHADTKVTGEVRHPAIG